MALIDNLMLTLPVLLSVPDTFLALRDFRITFTSSEVTSLTEAKVLLELK